MSSHPDPSAPTTTDAVRAGSATRDEHGASSNEAAAGRRPACRGVGKTFVLGAGVERGAMGHPHEREPGEPLYRPLRIYTVDPGVRQDDGATAVVNVPYEPLTRGIRGSVFHVRPVLKRFEDDDAPAETQDIDLNDPVLLLTNGRAPSPVDPLFHQQMVYAIASLVYASFRSALGRYPTWGFDAHPDDGGHARLRLSPHGNANSAGAAYDRDAGEVAFGFARVEGETRGRGAPGGHTFSCVSHDIVAHEVTHALLDGLRAHFLEPTSPDVLGFHEGFADVITLLHHFSYNGVVRNAVRRSRGKVLQSTLLTSIAIEFGLTTGNGGPLRSLAKVRARARAQARAAMHGRRAMAGMMHEDALAAPGEDEILPRYDEGLEPQPMGEVFTSAVFHAFAIVYTRKAERYLRLATGGTGVLPLGDISPDLQDMLAEEASQLASQFLNVCIRAIDYCPPVDLQLGDFLRAVITADLDLVPDDPWGYREAWIDAFALHGIHPAGVQSMSEDELRWDFNSEKALAVKSLSFTRLAFNGDPACPANTTELRRRACALGRFVAKYPEKFGLVRPGHERLGGDDVTLPEVKSVRSSRRIGPDGQAIFDLVAEVTQTRMVVDDEDGYRFLFRGGSTIILGPHGEVRYVIAKPVIENGRVFRQHQFMLGAGAGHATLRPDGWNEADAGTAQFRYPNP